MNRPGVVVVAVFAVALLGGLWVLGPGGGSEGADSGPGAHQELGNGGEGGFLRGLGIRSGDDAEDSGPSKQARARLLFDALRNEFPELQVDMRDVAPDENGYHQLHLLAESIEGPRLNAIRNGLRALQDEWCDDRARRLLEETEDLLAECRRIAALEQTSAFMDGRFLSAFHVDLSKMIDLSRLMMLEARIEMEDGRSSNGREIMHDVLALAGHLENLETQSMSCLTRVMMLRSQRAWWLLEQALVADADTLDPEMMRSFIAMPDLSAERAAHLIRGEWNNSADTLGHLFVDMIDEDQLPDGLAMAKFLAARAAQQIRKLESQGDLVDFQFPPEPAIPDDMSAAAREIIEMLVDTDTVLALLPRGTRHQHLLRDMQYAAIHLWESEREGLPLPSEVTEPVSGRSFRVDPEARTIFPPEHAEGEDAPNIDPIVLPRRE